MTPIPSFPLKGEGECRVFMNMSIAKMVNVWLGDVLGAQLKSAEEERGRLVESVLSMVGVGG